MDEAGESPKKRANQRNALKSTGPVTRPGKLRVRKNALKHGLAVGDRRGSHLVNIHKVWNRICTRAQIVDARIHDLRHSYASIAVGAGIGLYLTGKILGHLRNTTTERYAHLADDPIRQANELVGKRLSDALSRAVRDVEMP